MDVSRIQEVLNEAVALARLNREGEPAAYIPELANVSLAMTSAAMTLCNGTCLIAGDAAQHRFTLQSVAKVILLAGMLEEKGEQQVFSWINAEPSGLPFSSAAQLDIFGPTPSNPLVNAGAIVLCSHLQGERQTRLAWLEQWAEKLLGGRVQIDARVFYSELQTGDRNRALAYLMKSNGVITGDITEVLHTYFYLCSMESNVMQASRMAMLLAHGGCDHTGNRILSERTVAIVTAIMATSGLYDESGMHLVRTGLPAKSGVSGLIVAVALGQAGIAVASPRINEKGGSVRGHIMLEHLSRELGWHFALRGKSETW
ncbi:glutaminase A [candidate division KSB1 bacterium]|nr:glutaminase A [candidate division KSB1 bacterium]